MNHFTLITLSVLAGIGASISGCAKSERETDGPSTVASTPAPAPQQAFDIEANMHATVEALHAERAVLTKALKSWTSIDASDREAFWAALTEQRRLAEELAAALKANPTWVESVCGWYDSTLRKANDQTVRLRNQLRDRNMGSASRSDFNQLLLDAAGSQAAVQDHVRAMMESSGGPTNVHIMCVKFGYLDDDS